MSMRRPRVALILLAFVLPLLLPAPAPAQSPPNLALLRVMYTTRKATVKPEGELKAQIDAIDRELNEAARFGRTGQARRLLAKGMALLSGTAWTDALDYANSLVLRADRLFVDPATPLTVRLEQIYSPAIQLTRSLTARVALTRPPALAAGRAGRGAGAAAVRGAGRGAGVAAARGTGGRGAAAATVVKDLGTLDGVSRDLTDSPFPIVIDLAGVEAGPCRVRVEVLDGETLVATRTLDVVVSPRLDERLRRIDAEAAKAPAAFRAEATFARDRIRNIDLGRFPMGNFDPADELSRAERALPAVKAGSDPWAGKTGDLRRHYLLEAANEIMPYRVYVPTRYDGTRKMPLVVALHGLGGTEDAFFESYDGLLPRLAEQRGYLVAAPLGFRIDGGYGYGLSGATGDALARRTQEFSAADVMEVLAQMKKLYRVDENRIYLMGHSMGAIGTWRLGAAHPDIWAALAPISGFGAPATVETMRHIPEIVVHGDADPTVPVAGSRLMVAAMTKLGVDVKYIEVPGGNHGDVVVPNLPAIFDFFDTHMKK